MAVLARAIRRTRKRFNYYYLDDYCAGENSASLCAVQPVYSRAETWFVKIHVCKVSRCRYSATVLFAYTEDHVNVRLPFINFEIGNCVSQCDSIMQFLGSRSRISQSTLGQSFISILKIVNNNKLEKVNQYLLKLISKYV